MRILIFAPRKEKSNAYLRFIKCAVRKIAKENGVAFTENVKDVSRFDSFIFFKPVDISRINAWWIYHVKLPWIAKRIRANKIISLTGAAIASPTPQSIICSLPNKKTQFYWQWNAQKKLKQSINKSLSVFTYNHEIFSSAEKIHRLRPFLLDKKISISEEERIKLKNEHANTFEFFYASFEKINEEDFVFLLKAFSKFKKWQLSNMQLLVEGSESDFPSDKLSSYKYRRDIHFIKKSNDKIKAAAYASIHITKDETDVIPVLKSFQLQVPIIVSSNVLIVDEFSAAVLVFDNHSFEMLAKQMIDIYKDETKRGQLEDIGNQIVQAVNINEAKDELWRLLF